MEIYVEDETSLALYGLRLRSGYLISGPDIEPDITVRGGLMSDISLFHFIAIQHNKPSHLIFSLISGPDNA